MNGFELRAVIVAGCGLLAISDHSASAADLTFVGACDASAAILLGSGEIAVADDENPDVIRRYATAGGAPRSTTGETIESWLGQKKPDKEADLEGAAAIDGTLYWIGSHSRDAEGGRERERRVLFATDGDLRPVGKPFTELLSTLREEDGAWQVGLREAIGNPEDRVADLAPEKNGLNIEGLGYLPPAASGGAAGIALLGLRNPTAPDRKALLLPLLNIAAVTAGAAAPRFDAPIELDLGGLGVRDLAWWSQRDVMLVLAGSRDGFADFRIYQWTGASGAAPELLRKVSDLGPEVIVPLDTQRVLLLSDDGDVAHAATADECKKDKLEGGLCPCKHLLDPDGKSFRGRVVSLD